MPPYSRRRFLQPWSKKQESSPPSEQFPFPPNEGPQRETFPVQLREHHEVGSSRSGVKMWTAEDVLEIVVGNFGSGL
jgi:hypothetical protein